jgi:hypothetical protein
MADLWGHPSGSPAPAIDQRIWAIDTDRDVEIDYEQSVFKNDYVSGLDVEMSNITAMQKCDALYQLATKIRALVAKRLECESVLFCVSHGGLQLHITHQSKSTDLVLGCFTSFIGFKGISSSSYDSNLYPAQVNASTT